MNQPTIVELNKYYSKALDQLRQENATLKAQLEQVGIALTEAKRDSDQATQNILANARAATLFRDERDQLKAQLEQAVCDICKNPVSPEMPLVHRQCGKFESDIGDVLLNEARQERDQAQAACAQKDGVLHLAKEMTRPGFHPNPYRGLEHSHFDLHAAIEKALSTTCGQHYFHVDELTPTIELLERFEDFVRRIAREHKSGDEWTAMARELLNLDHQGNPKP